MTKNVDVKKKSEKSDVITKDNKDVLENHADLHAILSTIKPLIDLGRSRGYLTYTELNNALAEDCQENVYEEVIRLIEDFDIKIVKSAKNSDSNTEKEDEEEDDRGSQSGPPNAMSLYMAQMSKIPLLTKEDEIEIAKRIEDGRAAILETLLKTSVGLATIISVYDEVVNGTILLRDVVEIDSLYHDLYAPDQQTDEQFESQIEVRANLDNENYDEETDELEGSDVDGSIIDNDGTISISVMEKHLMGHVTSMLSGVVGKMQQMIQIAKTTPNVLSSSKYLCLANDVFNVVRDIRLNQSIINNILRGILDINKQVVEIECQIVDLFVKEGCNSDDIFKNILSVQIESKDWLLDITASAKKNKNLLNCITKHKKILINIANQIRYIHTKDIIFSVADFKHLVNLVQKHDRSTKKAKKEMIEGNLRLVPSIAKRFTNKGLSMSDLFQYGNIGLAQAVEKFQSRHKCKFATYGRWWIQQKILRAISDNRMIRIPAHKVDDLAKMNKIIRDFKKKNQKEPSIQEIATEMCIKPEKVAQMQRIAGDPMSLESPVGHDNENTFGDFIEDKKSTSPHKEAVILDLKKIISELLDGLTPREQRVIRMRFGIDVPKDYTLEEVGDQFGVTRERIRQIEAKALRKLRHPRRSMLLKFFLNNLDE